MNLKEIEKKRQQLIKTANEHGIHSTKVINLSRELDILLFQYQTAQTSLSPSFSPKKIC
ncbi:MAG: aspartyl-phosphate phosphatase Spo0E family protein [Tuberibacillus sp.]